VLQRFEPTRLSLAILPLIRDRYSQHYHSILLETISESHIIEIEICGDLVGPIYAVGDMFGTQPFANSVIGDFPKSLLNESELEFSRHLDAYGVSWVRNQPGRGWYSVAGSSSSRFYPDFLVLLEEEKDRHFGRIIAVETKGSHLIDSTDSLRKAEICASISSRFGQKVALIFDSFSGARIKLANYLTEQ
jgi:hypothetical protein